jgi:hypothetical protein
MSAVVIVKRLLRRFLMSLTRADGFKNSNESLAKNHLMIDPFVWHHRIRREGRMLDGADAKFTSVLIRKFEVPQDVTEEEKGEF